MLDTSVIIERAEERTGVELPDPVAISVMTAAELKIGVLLASTAEVRAARLTVLSAVEREFSPLPVDDRVANCFAAIVAEAKERGRRPKVVDALIGATALAHDLPLYTRDLDFIGMAGVEAVIVK